MSLQFRRWWMYCLWCSLSLLLILYLFKRHKKHFTIFFCSWFQISFEHLHSGYAKTSKSTLNSLSIDRWVINFIYSEHLRCKKNGQIFTTFPYYWQTNMMYWFNCKSLVFRHSEIGLLHEGERGERMCSTVLRQDMRQETVHFHWIQPLVTNIKS